MEEEKNVDHDEERKQGEMTPVKKDESPFDKASDLSPSPGSEFKEEQKTINP